jgi:hypothetical protein
MTKENTTNSATGHFGRMSLTAKLASVIVVVNLIGLARPSFCFRTTPRKRCVRTPS